MKNIYSKMNKFFDEEIKSDIRDILITKDRHGTISLFGKYVIRQTNDCLYRVTTNNMSLLFGEIQNALAYVILMNEGKTRQANRIEFLDNYLASINFDIVVHRRMLKKKNENRSFYMTQIQEKVIKKKNTIGEIKSYVELCKKLQEEKFNNANKPRIKQIR